MSARRTARPLSCEPLERRDLLAATNLSGCVPHDPLPTRDLPDELQTARVLTTGRGQDLGALTAARTIHGDVGRTEASDHYRFHVDRPSEVTLHLTGLTANVDVDLTDGRGRAVASSRRGGTHAESLRHTLPAGDYVLRVTAVRRAVSSYRLDVAAIPFGPAVPDRVGNHPAAAREVEGLPGSYVFRDRVGPLDAVDFYRFQLSDRSRLQMQLNGLSDDVDLYVYDTRGRLRGQSTGPGATAERLTGRLPAGTYLIAVVPYRAAHSEYVLTVSAQTLLPPAPSDTPTSTRPLPDAGQPLAPVSYYGGAQDWNLNDVQAPEAWAAGYTGEGVTVAVIDTGVDIQHADLRHAVWRNTDEVGGDGVDNDRNGFVDDVFGWDFAAGDAGVTDLNGHGTHVAGTIAAGRNGFGATGVAYAAQIMPVRVLGANGSGSTNAIARGIRYAVDNGADIINLSLGGGYSFAIRTALQYALARDVLVVAAAGNSGDASPAYPARHSAELPNVLSVGAHTRNGRVASFSNGPSSGAAQVDAPGARIFSTLPGNRHGFLSGTSMAAPHVAGLAALLLSANPALTAAQVRQLIMSGAQQETRGPRASGGIDAAVTVPLAGAVPVGSGAPSAPSGRNGGAPTNAANQQNFAATQAPIVMVAATTPTADTPSEALFSFAPVDDDVVTGPTAVPPRWLPAFGDDSVRTLALLEYLQALETAESPEWDSLSLHVVI